VPKPKKPPVKSCLWQYSFFNFQKIHKKILNFCQFANWLSRNFRARIVDSLRRKKGGLAVELGGDFKLTPGEMANSSKNVKNILWKCFCWTWWLNCWGSALNWELEHVFPSIYTNENCSPYIWLILPELMCSFQRLSHACISINDFIVKPRTAHYNSYNLLDLDFLLG
jgi:hypothetical protein